MSVWFTTFTCVSKQSYYCCVMDIFVTSAKRGKDDSRHITPVHVISCASPLYPPCLFPSCCTRPTRFATGDEAYLDLARELRRKAEERRQKGLDRLLREPEGVLCRPHEAFALLVRGRGSGGGGVTRAEFCEVRVLTKQSQKKAPRGVAVCGCLSVLR